MKARLPRMFTENEMNEFVAYHEMMFLLALHDIFGFGPDRMRRTIRGMQEKHEDYRKYVDHHDPKFGSRSKDGKERMDLWKAKHDLIQIGYDWDKETAKLLKK